MNTEPGYVQVMQVPDLISKIACCMHTSNDKLRMMVAEMLAAICVMTVEGHKYVC